MGFTLKMFKRKSEFPAIRISSDECTFSPGTPLEWKTIACYAEIGNKIFFGNWNNRIFITYSEFTENKSRIDFPEEFTIACLNHEVLHWVLQLILRLSIWESGGIDRIVGKTGREDTLGLPLPSINGKRLIMRFDSQ